MQSHRFVLRLNGGDANALFNTAQALCSLAEELDDDIESERSEAISLLQEAIEFFSLCLAKHEAAYSDSERLFAAENVDVDINKADTAAKELGNSQTYSTEQIAQVIVPVTPDDLTDTALAELEALEQLVLLLAADGGSAIEPLKEIADVLTQQKLPYYLSLIRDKSQKANNGQRDAKNSKHIGHESSLAIASWQTSLFIAEYRRGITDIHALLRKINDVYLSTRSVLEQDEEKLEIFSLLIAQAEAFLSIARLLGGEIRALTNPFYDLNADFKLHCLTEAQGIFQSLIKSVPEEKARLLIECGDCCLQRLQICQLQGLPDNLQLRAADQVSEAKDLYSQAREASTMSDNHRGSDGSINIGTTDEAKIMMKSEAVVKEAMSIALYLNLTNSVIPDLKDVQTGLTSIRKQRVEQILRDIIDGRLVPGSLEAVKDLLRKLYN